MTQETEGFKFSPGFNVDVDPEFPGDGDWRCPFYAFDRDGQIIEQPESRWGAPLIGRVHTRAGEWVGSFAAGGLGGVRGFFATPGRTFACALVDGLAYVVDTVQPQRGAQIVAHQVHQVVAIADPPRLLLVSFFDIVALGDRGVVWTTPRLGADDLRVERVDASAIVCHVDDLGGDGIVTVDPRTGKQTGGTRFNWPE